ncbi:MAG TPA: c-type cytochrome, partial [Gemmatales bacterium]|nr:c-type cytochrome [Gemmatales bacterium]
MKNRRLFPVNLQVRYQPFRYPGRLPLLGVVLLLSMLGFRLLQADENKTQQNQPQENPSSPASISPGQLLYQKQCLRCHGAQGEGVKKKYEAALEGDKSVQELTRQIQKTMPEDAPESLTLEEAEQVARYIHDAFYSRIARERNRPARIDLSRLTVRQFKLAVADVIGHKQGKGWFGEKRGLKGDYFAARHWRGDKKAFERIDSTINFDFGTKSPAPDKPEDAKQPLADYEFYIHWFGGVLAQETGWHDIVIQSNQA